MIIDTNIIGLRSLIFNRIRSPEEEGDWEWEYQEVAADEVHLYEHYGIEEID